MAEKNNKKVSIKKVKKSSEIDLRSDRDIGMDFAIKVYEKFDKMIKAVVMFGSSAKNTSTSSSDIDLVILIDDASIKWDQELIAWYREELGKIASVNRYKKELHITTIKITTWWNDLIKGDPVIINMLRYGDALIDMGGFFNPLKSLLEQGRIKPTNEAIYTALQRAPEHFRRSKISILGSIDGLFWAMVDSAQAALMAYKVMPPSYEHIPTLMKETFVDTRKLRMDYVIWYRDLYILHRQIVHGEVTHIKGADIDLWQKRTEEFISTMVKLVKDTLG